MADDKKTEDDKKTDDKKKAEDLTPTPTQAEADEFKVKLTGGPDAKIEKREAREAPPEILTPTPTQAENDAAKQAAMNEEPPPINEIDPPPEGGVTRRAVEADKPGGYSTRSKKPE